MHRAFKDKLSKLTEGKEDDKKPVPEDELKDAYKALKEVIPEMDYDSVEMIVDQILSYKLPDADAVFFGKLKTNLKAVNWEELEKMIQEK